MAPPPRWAVESVGCRAAAAVRCDDSKCVTGAPGDERKLNITAYSYLIVKRRTKSTCAHCYESVRDKRRRKEL